jgi:four helix bundle protein
VRDMTKLEDFRDLTVWQKARELARLVYAVTQRKASVDNHVVTEIRNSAVTIGSKIAAAFGTRGDPYSQEMLNLAKAACGGLKMQLTVVRDQGWMKPNEYEELMGRITEIRQLLFDLETMLDFWRKQQGYHKDDLE